MCVHIIIVLYCAARVSCILFIAERTPPRVSPTTPKYEINTREFAVWLFIRLRGTRPAGKVQRGRRESIFEIVCGDRFFYNTHTPAIISSNLPTYTYTFTYIILYIYIARRLYVYCTSTHIYIHHTYYTHLYYNRCIFLFSTRISVFYSDPNIMLNIRTIIRRCRPSGTNL